MLRSLTSLAMAFGLSAMALPAAAQFSEATVSETRLETNPDYCISTLAEFPADNHEIRYQFFRLTDEMARDITPELREAMRIYGAQNLPTDRPMLKAIEDIANPVLRQAAPEITVANMAYVIDFASICRPIIDGQINSLAAYDSSLSDPEFNAVIVEDALFLRQILSDSLIRLGADTDPLFSASVVEYSAALVSTRDEAEFVSFEAELDDIEALYMDDLDQRLKRANDMINEEIDSEVLSDSVALSDSMNRAEKRKAKERQLYTLIRILGGGN